MATRLDSEGRRLLESILTASSAHRAKCSGISFRGDREACANIADAAERFVAEGGSRLLQRSEDGDDDAHRRLMDTGGRILATVGGAFSEVSRGVMVGDLVDAIKKDAGNVVKVGGFSLAVVAIATAALYLALAPGPVAAIVRRKAAA
ncbi:MAG: hypothetical protein IT382_01820 [Deltaproteobacteria bacterium]|nr:hypothetical protein [Deltaproteobacteria bacterium]